MREKIQKNKIQLSKNIEFLNLIKIFVSSLKNILLGLNLFLRLLILSGLAKYK